MGKYLHDLFNVWAENEWDACAWVYIIMTVCLILQRIVTEFLIYDDGQSLKIARGCIVQTKLPPSISQKIDEIGELDYTYLNHKNERTWKGICEHYSYLLEEAALLLMQLWAVLSAFKFVNNNATEMFDFPFNLTELAKPPAITAASAFVLGILDILFFAVVLTIPILIIRNLIITPVALLLRSTPFLWKDRKKYRHILAEYRKESDWDQVNVAQYPEFEEMLDANIRKLKKMQKIIQFKYNNRYKIENILVYFTIGSMFPACFIYALF